MITYLQKAGFNKQLQPNTGEKAFLATSEIALLSLSFIIVLTLNLFCIVLPYRITAHDHTGENDSSRELVDMGHKLCFMT